ncbi:MAG: TetR/AcrR family transcriptional regulator C-terminal domain-containing protein [Firmicutes bacterium]|nr:TetR/AcrR family transcriptional regulator C-terminal domain-containing protein [Bacillota bacterium]
MNTKENERYQVNESAFYTAMEMLLETEPFEKITVKALCERAGLHRTTFYTHFQDTQGLLEKMYYAMRDDIASSTASVVREPDFILNPDYYILSLNVMKKYRGLILCVRHRGIGGKMPILEGHHIAYYEIYTPLFDAHHVPADEREYFYHYFMSGWLAVANRWIERGCPEPPEKVASLLVRLAKGYLT